MNPSGTAVEAFGLFVDASVYVVCIAGLAASAALTGWAISVFPAALTDAAAALLDGTIAALAIVGAAFLFRYRELTYRTPPRQAEMTRFAGCPRWIRVVCYGFMIVGVAVFTGSAAMEFFNFLTAATGNAIRIGAFGWVAFGFILAQSVSLRTLAHRVANRRRDQDSRHVAAFGRHSRR
jgi:hypothetical protein